MLFQIASSIAFCITPFLIQNAHSRREGSYEWKRGSPLRILNAKRCKNNKPLYVIGLNTFLILEELRKESTIFRYVNGNEFPIQISTIVNLTTNELMNNCLTYSDNMCVISYLENYKNFDEYRDVILSFFLQSIRTRNIYWKNTHFY